MTVSLRGYTQVSADAGMNSSKKGSTFEDTVFKVVSRLIENGEFFLGPENCKSFLRKGYYSRDRRAEIIFDVAIEVFRPGSSKFSFLLLIECKNYSYKVPVDDVEEFNQKMKQVAPSNSKGFIVTTSGFQKGAYHFCEANGIGMGRVIDDKDIEWILDRPASSLAYVNGKKEEDAFEVLIGERDKSRYLNFYGHVDGKFCHSLKGLMSVGMSSVSEDIGSSGDLSCESMGCRVPYLDLDEIERTSLSFLHKAGWDGDWIDFHEIFKYLKKEYLFDFMYGPLEDEAIGRVSFRNSIICVDRDKISDDYRCRFTEAHEVGHVVLGHGSYVIEEVIRMSDLEVEKRFNLKDVDRMEYQANYFASCLLMPKNKFIHDVLCEANKLSLIPRKGVVVYLDSQRCNQYSFYCIAREISAKYAASISAVKIRMKSLGLLVEEEKGKRVKDISSGVFRKILRRN